MCTYILEEPRNFAFVQEKIDTEAWGVNMQLNVAFQKFMFSLTLKPHEGESIFCFIAG